MTDREMAERTAHDVWATVKAAHHHVYSDDDVIVLTEALDELRKLVMRNERRVA